MNIGLPPLSAPEPEPEFSWLATEVTADAGCFRARLSGALDLCTVDQLTGLVDELVRGGCRSLVLDLAGLELCDARGLAAFLAVERVLVEAGGDLTMTGLSPLIRELMEITALGGVFQLR